MIPHANACAQPECARTCSKLYAATDPAAVGRPECGLRPEIGSTSQTEDDLQPLVGGGEALTAISDHYDVLDAAGRTPLFI